MYGMLEGQFRQYFKKADLQKGVTGENLLIMLERRLDSMIYRLGFSTSRSEARQLVRHCHFLVNGRKVNIPSYRVKEGDVIEVRNRSKQLAIVLEAAQLPDAVAVATPGRGDVAAVPGVEEHAAAAAAAQPTLPTDVRRPLKVEDAAVTREQAAAVLDARSTLEHADRQVTDDRCASYRKAERYEHGGAHLEHAAHVYQVFIHQ